MPVQRETETNFIIKKIKSNVERAVRPVMVEGFSIDPPGSKEIDQTIKCDRGPDGEYNITVALADPTSFIRRGSRIERGAYHQAFNLYGQEQSASILPEELSTDVFSLKQGTTRPGIIVELEFDSQKKYSSILIHQGRVKNTAELTYVQADQEMSNPSSPNGKQLRDMLEIAVALQPQDGKVLHDLDRGILLIGENLIVGDPQDQTSSSVVNRELMNFANSKLAEICFDYGVSVISKKSRVFIYGPDEKLLAKFTAPLRRYSDFFCQAKLIELLQYSQGHEDPQKLKNICINMTNSFYQYQNIERKIELDRNISEYSQGSPPVHRWKGNSELELQVSQMNYTIHNFLVDKIMSGKITQAEELAVRVALNRNPRGWEDIAALL